MARLAVYGAISTVLAGGVIASAFAQRSNFYAACIYLYKSNACMMILLNLGLFLTIIAGQLVQIIFFGNLRTLEVEHLYERAWYAVTETCLAMTIFKDEFDTRFVVMFTVLLFLKVFHWLCQDRVDSMEQSPEIPVSFHVRMVTMIAMLVSLDVLLVLHAIDLVTLKGPNMMIMFGFEYTLLATSLLASFGKYVLHTIDLRSEDPWENKSMLLFYLDLVADFVKLVTYLFFFMVILVCYGLPLHIIRDVYMTMRSFLQKCKDLIQYRKATRNMNERYPDASPAELAALSDPICIICREEMVGHHQQHVPPTETGAGGSAASANTPPARPPTPRSSASNTNVPKKLPCGHIFHFHCLKSWLERQQSCPTCRRLVLDPPTPTPTPVPQPQGDAVQGLGAPGATAPAGAQQQHGNIHPAGHMGHNAIHNNHVNNNVQAAAPLGLGQNAVPYHGVGFTLLAPQGQYPLAGWPPQMMVGGALPGAIPQDGAQAGAGSNGTGTTGTSGTSGTSAGAGVSAGTPGGVTPLAPHGNYIPNYSLPHVSHPIPGFIPLFPVGAAPPERQPVTNIWAAHTPVSSHTASAVSPSSQQQGSGSGADAGAAAIVDSGAGHTASSSSSSRSSDPGATSTGTRLATDQIPLTSLDALSEDQLRYLEENTRRGLQERLRILQAVESQIAESVGVLNRVLGALPPSGTSFRNGTEDPPSPIVAATVPTPTTAVPNGTNSSSSTSSTRGFAFGAGISPVGLQSSFLSRGVHGLEQTSSSQATPTSHRDVSEAQSTDNDANDSKEKEQSSPSSSPPSSSPIPTPLVETNAVSFNHSAEDLANGAPKSDLKGKGKKTEEEIEQEQEQEKESLAAMNIGQDAIMDGADEDSNHSPQEMVRRRWAQMDFSSHLQE
ncbi:E3 ubiquitin-protein ligase hrd1 [Mortierella sp. GBA30]|nr:E3 ubiquitin-protein ligase hrd1 [Mortierella sp. GBA30]